MILLFDMWIENVYVNGKIEPSKPFSGQCVTGEDNAFKNSLGVQREAQKLRINILIIFHIHE